MELSIEKLPDGLHPVSLEGNLGEAFVLDDDCHLASPVRLNGSLMVSEKSIVLQGDISVLMNFCCCRCLEKVQEKISSEIITYFEKTDRAIPDGEKLTEADDLEILDYGVKTIDLSHRVSEIINLNLPMKPLCNSDCKGLCPKCGNNLNKSSCACIKQQIDPRWQSLLTTLKEE